MDAPPTVTPRLSPDTYALVLSFLPITDVLSCARVCKKLRALCATKLQAGDVVVSGSAVNGAQLLWLVQERLHGAVTTLDVSGCEAITKASIAAAVAACPRLETLTALQVGPGCWSGKHLEKLLNANLPPGLRATVDVRLELKNDLHEASPMLASLSAPALVLRRLVLIADNVSRADGGGGGGGDGVGAASDGSAAAAVDAAAVAMAAVDISDDAGAHADADEPFDQPGVEHAASLGRLLRALLPHARHLLELDASSGALGMPGAGSALLAPLLAAPSCALATLPNAYGSPHPTNDPPPPTHGSPPLPPMALLIPRVTA